MVYNLPKIWPGKSGENWNEIRSYQITEVKPFANSECKHNNKKLESKSFGQYFPHIFFWAFFPYIKSVNIRAYKKSI